MKLKEGIAGKYIRNKWIAMKIKEYTFGSLPIDELHDQYITSVLVKENEIRLIIKDFHMDEPYNNEKAEAYYDKHKNFKCCEIVFKGEDCLCSTVVKYKLKNQRIKKGKLIFIDELDALLKRKGYELQMYGMFIGYDSLIIKCCFMDKVGYHGECLLRIYADNIAYEWH